MTPEPNPQSVHYIAVIGDVTVEKRFTYAPGTFGYSFSDPKAPDCLKFWIGRQTFFIPIQHLLVFEMDT